VAATRENIRRHLGLVVLAAVLPVCSCTTTRYTAATDRIAQRIRRVREIDGELADIGQMMVYAGRFHGAPIANAALDAALDVLGLPDERERAYAEHLTENDIGDQRQSIRKLQREKIQCQADLDSSIACLREGIPRLQSAHNTLRLVKFATIAGGLLIAGLLLSRLL
jgi:hypothetical protein